MKTVKVKFIGFWDGFDYKKHALFKLIEKNYSIVESDDPDYIFCSVFGRPYEYCEYPQVRIFYSGENYTPDFNLVDYGISPYPVDFLDRHLYLPLCIYNGQGLCTELINKNRDYSPNVLKEKTVFANMIAGHDSEYELRSKFFYRLSEYKQVSSAGTLLNNTSNAVSRNDGSKHEFQKKSKFTLCFESTKHEGFVTEKIRDAFSADTIPVYYGSDTVKTLFNEKAFINVSDFENFDDVVELIKKLDNDDEAYLEMLRQPIFNDIEAVKRTEAEITAFFEHIFDQPAESAFRRSRLYAAKSVENHLIRLNGFDKKTNCEKSKSRLRSLFGKK